MVGDAASKEMSLALVKWTQGRVGRMGSVNGLLAVGFGVEVDAVLASEPI